MRPRISGGTGSGRGTTGTESNGDTNGDTDEDTSQSAGDLFRGREDSSSPVPGTSDTSDDGSESSGTSSSGGSSSSSDSSSSGGSSSNSDSSSSEDSPSPSAGEETPDRTSDLEADEQRFIRGRTDPQFGSPTPEPSVDDRGGRVPIDDVAQNSTQRSDIDRQRQEFAEDLERFDSDDVVIRQGEDGPVFDVRSAAIERELARDQAAIEDDMTAQGIRTDEFSVRFDSGNDEFDVTVDEFAVNQRVQSDLRDAIQEETGLDQRLIQINVTDDGFEGGIDEERLAEEQQRRADAFNVPSLGLDSSADQPQQQRDALNVPSFDSPGTSEDGIPLTGEQEFFDQFTGGRVNRAVQAAEGQRREIENAARQAFGTAGDVVATPGGVAVSGIAAVNRARDLDREDIENLNPGFGSAGTAAGRQASRFSPSELADSFPEPGAAAIEAASQANTIDVTVNFQDAADNTPAFGSGAFSAAQSTAELSEQADDVVAPPFASGAVSISQQLDEFIEEIETSGVRPPQFGAAASETAAQIDDSGIAEAPQNVEIDEEDVSNLFSAPSIVDDVRSGARPGVDRVGQGLSDRGGVGEAAVAAGTLGVAAPEPTSTAAGAAVLLGGAGLIAADQALNQRINEIETPTDRSSFEQTEIETPNTGVSTPVSSEIGTPSRREEFDVTEVPTPTTPNLDQSEISVDTTPTTTFSVGETPLQLGFATQQIEVELTDENIEDIDLSQLSQSSRTAVIEESLRQSGDQDLIQDEPTATEIEESFQEFEQQNQTQNLFPDESGLQNQITTGQQSETAVQDVFEAPARPGQTQTGRQRLGQRDLFTAPSADVTAGQITTGLQVNDIAPGLQTATPDVFSTPTVESTQMTTEMFEPEIVDSPSFGEGFGDGLGQPRDRRRRPPRPPRFDLPESSFEFDTTGVDELTDTFETGIAQASDFGLETTIDEDEFWG